MTISAAYTPTKVVGTGANTPIPTVFPFFDSTDLVVTRTVTATEADTLMVLGVDYTVSGGSEFGATGTVTPVNGVVDFTAAMVWTIQRSVPLTQSLVYVENDDFPATSHEAGLDRLTLQNQDVSEQIGRTMLIPATGSDGASFFDARGNRLGNVGTPVDGDDVVTKDYADAINVGTTGAVIATGSVTSRTFQDRFGDWLNVKDFGAVGNGIADDTTEFQAAIDTLSGTEGTIYLPDGDYVVDLYALTYGSKCVRWVMADSATTTKVNSPQCYIFPAGASFGSTHSVDVTPSSTDHTDIYRVFAENNATGAASLFAYHFDMIGHGTGESVRGLIGTVTNAATVLGSAKAVRVKALDANVTTGAVVIVAVSADVQPTPVTQAARVLEIVNAGLAGTDDVAEAMHVFSDTARWKNGIVFDQGDEYNDSVMQASMGAGSSAGALFLKLKNAAAATLFSVTRLGAVIGASFDSGSSTTNGINIGTAAIQRTATNGDLTIGSGSVSGAFNIQALGATQLQIVTTGAEIPTGKRITLGGSTRHISFGSGDPNTVVTASPGSMYLNTSGGAGTTLYVKESGSATNTGWVGK